jgi:hypothetical protein
MSEIDRIFSLIPDAYDKRQTLANPNYSFLKGVGAATGRLRDDITDFIDDQTIALADGEGLDRLGLLYDLGRPKWMTDTQFRTVLGIWVSEPRCTLIAIKKMFDAWTGTTCTIEDKSTNAAIPDLEIWVTPPVNFWQMHGMGIYPDTAPGDTWYDGYPLESALGGEVSAGYGFLDAQLNDHVMGVDSTLQYVLDRMRAAGTVIVYKQP